MLEERVDVPMISEEWLTLANRMKSITNSGEEQERLSAIAQIPAAFFSDVQALANAVLEFDKELKSYRSLIHRSRPK